MPLSAALETEGFHRRRERLRRLAARGRGAKPSFPFFRHFFVERQRNGITAAQRGAKQYARQQKK
jgi:hypothetical protein